MPGPSFWQRVKRFEKLISKYLRDAVRYSAAAMQKLHESMRTQLHIPMHTICM